jgi:hypothetical protein
MLAMLAHGCVSYAACYDMVCRGVLLLLLLLLARPSAVLATITSNCTVSNQPQPLLKFYCLAHNLLHCGRQQRRVLYLARTLAEALTQSKQFAAILRSLQALEPHVHQPSP